MGANGMLTFIDGTEREQSVQDVLHLHRLVKGGVIQDSTLLWCADELRWLQPLSSMYIARSKNSLKTKGISRRGLPRGLLRLNRRSPNSPTRSDSSRRWTHS